MRMVAAREIVGRRIVAFRPNPSADGKIGMGGRAAIVHYPEIELDDGSVLYFVTEEVDEGADYGTFIGRRPKEKS